MTAPVDVTGGRSDEPLGHLVVDEGGSQRRVPIFDQLYVGRECAGISERRRLVIPDPEVSRTHFEIRLDVGADQAFLIDVSSNGTLLNGVRVERAVSLPIKPDDEIRVGDVTLTFRSTRFTAVSETPARSTKARISQTAMVMVVGDIVNYSAISHVTDEAEFAHGLHELWRRVGGVVRAHHGTVSHNAGDALFVVWEIHRFPNAADLAIDFALAANRLVEDVGPKLSLRDQTDSPIQMGWGVVAGIAALAPMNKSVDAIVGDSANVAFRLAGLAGRSGRAAVVVTDAVRRVATAKFSWGPGESVPIKGRRVAETVFPLLDRDNNC